jgi:hypothetical protein
MRVPPINSITQLLDLFNIVRQSLENQSKVATHTQKMKQAYSHSEKIHVEFRFMQRI